MMMWWQRHSNLLQLLRIQSPEGTKRIDVSASDSTCQLYEKVYSTFDLNSFAFALYKEKGQKDEIQSSRSKTIRSFGLRHGDMLYLAPINGAVLFQQSSTNHVSKGGQYVPYYEFSKRICCIYLKYHLYNYN